MQWRWFKTSCRSAKLQKWLLSSRPRILLSMQRLSAVCRSSTPRTLWPSGGAACRAPEAPSFDLSHPASGRELSNWTCASWIKGPQAFASKIENHCSQRLMTLRLRARPHSAAALKKLAAVVPSDATARVVAPRMCSQYLLFRALGSYSHAGKPIKCRGCSNFVGFSDACDASPTGTSGKEEASADSSANVCQHSRLRHGGTVVRMQSN